MATVSSMIEGLGELFRIKEKYAHQDRLQKSPFRCTVSKLGPSETATPSDLLTPDLAKLQAMREPKPSTNMWGLL